MYLSSNIKFLRKRKGLSQNDLAIILETKRSNINNYENDVAIPTANTLIVLSDFFHISIDTLLRINLSTLRESQMYMIENGSDVFIKGNEIRVLATTVNSSNKDNIELVSIKAKAGYTNGYFDAEYISNLPVFNLPFLSTEKKYRTFQISGDSMLPVKDKSWVVGEFVQSFLDIKNDHFYIILTLNEGIVFKKVDIDIPNGRLKMISTNPEYKPYEISMGEIREVWKFVLYMNDEFPEVLDNAQIFNNLEQIKNELKDIRKRIGD